MDSVRSDRQRPTRDARRALAALVVGGCASTVDGTVRDGSTDVVAAQDVSTRDGPAGPCRWRALSAVEVLGAGTRLIDAVPTGDGAWVAYRERLPSGSSEVLRVVRVDGDGHARPLRADLLSLAEEAALDVSMDWDAAHGVLALLTRGPTDRGRCVWSALTAAGGHATRTVDPAAAGPGLRSGCRALLRTRNGYSFASEQVRAPWGTDLITMSHNGDLTGYHSLPMVVALAEQLVRTSLADGDFLAAWSEPTGNASALRAQRLSEGGDPRGPVARLGTADRDFERAVVVETAGGMLALWNGATRSDPLVASALDATGAPAGDLVSHTALGPIRGGLSAARRGNEVLATAVSAEWSRLWVLSLDARGVAGMILNAGITGVRPNEPVRVVATSSGALVLATEPRVATSIATGAVVAVPLLCE